MNGYVVALDQGTTSSRAIVFDAKGVPVTIAQYPFAQIYPKPGWVEHDPMIILETQFRALAEAFEKSELSPTDISGIGITNQRETTIVWDKNTGKPVYNAIVWQCRRTAPICDKLTAEGIGEDRSSHRRVLFRHENKMDTRQCRRCARKSRARRAAVRQCRFLAHMESHRRQGACFRLLELLAHDAV